MTPCQKHGGILNAGLTDIHYQKTDGVGWRYCEIRGIMMSGGGIFQMNHIGILTQSQSVSH